MGEGEKKKSEDFKPTHRAPTHMQKHKLMWLCAKVLTGCQEVDTCPAAKLETLFVHWITHFACGFGSLAIKLEHISFQSYLL